MWYHLLLLFILHLGRSFEKLSNIFTVHITAFPTNNYNSYLGKIEKLYHCTQSTVKRFSCSVFLVHIKPTSNGSTPKGFIRIPITSTGNNSDIFASHFIGRSPRTRRCFFGNETQSTFHPVFFGWRGIQFLRTKTRAWRIRLTRLTTMGRKCDSLWPLLWAYPTPRALFTTAQNHPMAINRLRPPHREGVYLRQ